MRRQAARRDLLPEPIELVRSRQLWLIMAMYWCYVWGSMFYLTWFPEYLLKGRGLREDEMAIFAAILLICLIMPSDWTQDIPRRYGKRHPGLHYSRMYPPVIE